LSSLPFAKDSFFGWHPRISDLGFRGGLGGPHPPLSRKTSFFFPFFRDMGLPPPPPLSLFPLHGFRQISPFFFFSLPLSLPLGGEHLCLFPSNRGPTPLSPPQENLPFFSSFFLEPQVYMKTGPPFSFFFIGKEEIPTGPPPSAWPTDFFFFFFFSLVAKDLSFFPSFFSILPDFTFYFAVIFLRHGGDPCLLDALVPSLFFFS